jgi:dihydrofolate synthase/folylpolyglutamate synthase
VNTLEMPATLAEWLERCEQAHPKEIDMTLARVRVVKQRLGVAFKAPVVVVAGTNGKGSTCAMLDSIARCAGWRVGLYSKPHLLHFEERCRINGDMVDAAQLLPHFEAVERARGGVSLTYFEHTTLAIMRLLSHAELDLVILEVGMGGRLDAVNVIDADCAVITSVDIDHTDYLGLDREAIGREKAGILRTGRSAVCGDLNAPDSVLALAEETGATLRLAGRDFHIAQGEPGRWLWRGWCTIRPDLPLPALIGAAQLWNAATALAVFDSLPLPAPSDEAVAEGLRSVSLPGRFQVVRREPEVILDVAHNEQAVRALAATLRARPCPGRTFAVFGCMRDKAIPVLVAQMDDQVSHWYVTDLPLPRAAKAADLLHQVGSHGAAPVSAFSDAWTALQAARRAASPLDRIVVFGSFITVGQVQRQLS